ncbi:hypothetical protein Q2K19_23145 [Micromonospora soli]|uniref:hypothetical protein n=1 Tax=Micromonospora sp. NBRC 110009 TaxID=3061627 RepID=UPI002672B374|nr:hypothetical protein [Micromonospora sp. NBRC 110009]WKT97058.1 hypothetical protein Q2K19_23145 [Micromonospora sp. NBRC 110009]
MTGVAVGHSRWQFGWAQRENDRRQAAYEAEVEVWRRDEERLLRLRIEAAGFLGCRQPRTGLPVDLADDEVVYRVMPDADLVEAEARHLTGLPAPALTAVTAPVHAPGRPLPTGLRVVDSGMAVVTNLRVAFAGRTGRREWRHADVRGPGHHPEVPVTLLHSGDGRRPAGLRVPAGAAVNFRFYLTLAFATATGHRAVLAAQVDALLAAHYGARPAPPHPVTAADAPAPLLRPERLAAAAAVAVAVTLGTLAASTVNAPAGGPHRAAPRASGPAAGADGRDAIGRPFPSAPASSPTGGGAVPSPTVGTATRSTGGASDPDGLVLRATVAERPGSAAPAAATPPSARTTPTGQSTGTPPATSESPSSTPTPSSAPTPTESAPATDPPAPAACLRSHRPPLRCPTGDDPAPPA